MSRHGWNPPGPLGLGISGLILSWFPVLGVPVSVAALWLAVRAVRRNRDDSRAITVLAFDAVVLASSVAALIWSVLIGLDGLMVSPSPN